MPFDCQSCGGCCAYSDTWPEFVEDLDGDGIDESLIDLALGRMRCDGDRCVALVGVVGAKVLCSVYERRPAVCREFQPGTAGCKQVRQWFKLPLAA